MLRRSASSTVLLALCAAGCGHSANHGGDDLGVHGGADLSVGGGDLGVVLGDGGGGSPDLGGPSFTPPDVAKYVNPIIGSNGADTFPGADTPFGMVQWSPENTTGNQTRTPYPGGYAYGVTKIRGFSLTHMSGTGCAGGFGDIPFFPMAAAVTTSPSSDSTDSIYASTFTHANETASAGYYSVKLDSGVQVELTATPRTGSGRFSYPAGKPQTLLIRTSGSEVGSENASITVDAANKVVTGWVKSGNFCGYINTVDRRSYYTLYFRAEFDQPISGSGTWKNGAVTAGATTASGGTGYGTDGFPPAGQGSGAYLTFGGSSPVGVRVGVSFVSPDNATANLAAENPAGTTFDTVKQAAYDLWNGELGCIAISGGSADQTAMFYTALYHSLMHPNIFSDVNGQYVGMDQSIHQLAATQKAQYANFSGWDVYRGQMQLVTLVDPTTAGDIAQSLLNQAAQNNGVWDRWTHAAGGTHVMTGDPGHIVVPTVYAFGGTNFDAHAALTSMVSAATQVTADDTSNAGWNVMVVGERPSLDKYLSIHYVPADGNAWGGVGETIEDVAADFAISQLAARLGDTTNHDAFLARSAYWQNVFNPAASNGVGYLMQRNSDGSWPTGFDPTSSDGFAEDSANVYTWNIPFNPAGLFAKMGGNAKALARLDAFFKDASGNWTLVDSSGTHADMTNEPSLDSPLLYSFAGAPYKTQAIVRAVMDQLWANAPGGIPGQDDLGAMSAWYVWSALGLYPQYPGRSELLVVAPLFPSAVVHRGNGVVITINAPAAADAVPYVQSLNVGGAVSTKAWLPESFVSGGGTLDFTLGAQPSLTWGSAAADVPPSFAP
jgi:predicted alpha-1,2-mannosidase